MVATINGRLTANLRGCCWSYPELYPTRTKQKDKYASAISSAFQVDHGCVTSTTEGPQQPPSHAGHQCS